MCTLCTWYGILTDVQDPDWRPVWDGVQMRCLLLRLDVWIGTLVLALLGMHRDDMVRIICCCELILIRSYLHNRYVSADDHDSPRLSIPNERQSGILFWHKGPYLPIYWRYGWPPQTKTTLTITYPIILPQTNKSTSPSSVSRPSYSKSPMSTIQAEA